MEDNGAFHVEQPGSNVLAVRMCRCGRAPYRQSGRNCHFCNKEANARYRAGLKNAIGYAKARKKAGVPLPTNDEGYIYFIRQGERGLIKIGHSADPHRRMRQLQTASPFELYLLGAVPARQALEPLFHDRFAIYRHCGEWFEPAKELYDFIAKVCATNTSGQVANTG